MILKNMRIQKRFANFKKEKKQKEPEENYKRKT